jgi:hypothetical protein
MKIQNLNLVRAQLLRSSSGKRTGSYLGEAGPSGDHPSLTGGLPRHATLGHSLGQSGRHGCSDPCPFLFASPEKALVDRERVPHAGHS